MSTTLEVAEHHDAAKVTDVQTIGGRVNAKVGGDLSTFEKVFGARHYLREHSAPFDFFEKISHFFLV
jgi:hypothetical protein